MARTRKSAIKNMNAGEVADDTREWFRVTSDYDVLQAVDAYDAYEEEFSAWLDDNPGMPRSDFDAIWSAKNGKQPPPEFAAVVDRNAITDREALFVEVRFFEEHDDNSKRTKINASWCQVNSTNITTLVPGDFAIFRKVFNARRTKLGLDPDPA